MFCCLFRIKVKQRKLVLYGCVIARPYSLCRSVVQYTVNGAKRPFQPLWEECSMSKWEREHMLEVLMDNAHFLSLLNCTDYDCVFTVLSGDVLCVEFENVLSNDSPYYRWRHPFIWRRIVRMVILNEW